MTAERDSFSVKNRVVDPGPGRFGGATLTEPAKDSLLAHYKDTCALYDPARRKGAYMGIAETLGRRIEQMAEDESSMHVEEYTNVR